MTGMQRGRREDCELLAMELEQHRARWLLLALHTTDGDGLTAVQLQKALFVLGRRDPKVAGRRFYHFQPYNYGPFDIEVYNDAEWLGLRGLIFVDGSRGHSLRTYHLSDNGERCAKSLAEQASASSLRYLRSLTEWVRSLSFAELVRAIYDAFPDMRQNSVFQDDLS
jgi:hypothetical protein